MLLVEHRDDLVAWFESRHAFADLEDDTCAVGAWDDAWLDFPRILGLRNEAVAIL